MDTKKYWREFEHSGKIGDYMSYKNDIDVRKKDKKSKLGESEVEGLCAGDRHSTKDEQCR